ncbi:hypothetical protein B0H13DRAFT_1853665 [Mycena leptocephala]|nr:hypothetical protein B0H13DRAFT_1853665 [Mycena leptocephala]
MPPTQIEILGGGACELVDVKQGEKWEITPRKITSQRNSSNTLTYGRKSAFSDFVMESQVEFLGSQVVHICLHSAPKRRQTWNIIIALDAKPRGNGALTRVAVIAKRSELHLRYLAEIIASGPPSIKFAVVAIKDGRRRRKAPSRKAAISPIKTRAAPVQFARSTPYDPIVHTARNLEDSGPCGGVPAARPGLASFVIAVGDDADGVRQKKCR